MSSPLAPSRPTSVEQRALRQIDSTTKTFVNKDFVKNMAWLNQSVDTHSAFLSKLQKGVDDANMNVIEQIQGFAADLFVLFAGGEPTGIEIGDLKYIIQGIGALFGINPGTPFPMNLIEAAANLLDNFIIPLEQFTDVIFDSIIAWAIDFGLSESFIASLQELQDAILSLGESFGGLFDAIGELLGAFGLLDWTSGPIGALWDALVDLLDLVPWNLLGGVLSLLADLGTPFINALTWLINTGANLLGFISGDQIKDLGDNVSPTPANNTTIWTVGVDPVTTWVFDAGISADDETGSFHTEGTGVAKRLLTQGNFPCAQDQKFLVNAKIRWTGIPSAANDFGVALVFYNGATELDSLYVNIAPGHGSTGGWGSVPATEVVVPHDADSFKIAAYVGASITTGQVWVDEISVQREGKVSLNILDGFWDVIESFLPIEFFSNVIGMVGAGLEDIYEWFTNKVLKWDSPINAANIIGSLASIPLSIIGLGNRNLLANPIFESSDSLVGETEWSWDGTVRHSTKGGSAKLIADAFPHELYSNAIEVEEGETVEMIIRVKWADLVSTGTPIALHAKLFNGDQEEVGYEVIEAIPAPGAESEWYELNGEYVVEEASFVCMGLVVNQSATSGTIWFSNGSMEKRRKTGIAPLDWIIGLPDALGSLDEFTQFLVDTFLEVIDGIPIVGGTLANLFAAVFDWFDDFLSAAAQAADAFFQAIGLTQILTRIFGGVETNELADAEEAVLAIDGRLVALEGGGVIATYTTSQTWTNPSPTEHNRIKVIVYSGGDGGGRCSTNFNDQAKGGRSGGYIEKEFWTDEIPSTVAITIGLGGAGATFGGGDGSDGAETSFGSLLVGRKGIGAVYKDGAKLPERGVPPGDGGQGAYRESSSDDTVLLASSAGTGGAFSAGGRAGFGSTGTAINGQNGDAQPTDTPSGGGGGGGGSCGTTTAGDGGNGGFPGGGGGGGAKNNSQYGNGGNGAQGAVQIVTEAA